MTESFDWSSETLAYEFPGLSEFVPLGKGGFASVFVARHPTLGTIALKILTGKPEWQSDEVGRAIFRERVQAEIHSIGQLGGRLNIVTLHTSGVSTSGWPFLLMELCTKGSVRDLMRRRIQDGLGPVHSEQAIDIGEKVGRALAHAHQCQILHLDVKPANILIDRFDAYKLSDFGIAQSISGTQSAGQSFYTPHYAAPEMMTVPSRPSPASDIYSLGATLFHVTTNQRVFEGSSGEELRDRVINDQARRLDEVVGDLPPAFVTAIAACLEKRPENRPSAADLLHILSSAIPDDDATDTYFQATAIPAIPAPPLDVQQRSEVRSDLGSQSLGDPNVTPNLPPRITPDQFADPSQIKTPQASPPPQNSDDYQSDFTVHLQESEPSKPKRRRVSWVVVGIAGALITAGLTYTIVRLVTDDKPTPVLSDDKLTANQNKVVFSEPSESGSPTPGSQPGQPGNLRVGEFKNQKVNLTWEVANARTGVEYVILRADFDVDPVTGLSKGGASQQGLVNPDGEIAATEDPIRRMDDRARSLSVPVDPARFSCFRVAAVDERFATPSPDQVCTPSEGPTAPSDLSALVDPTGATAALNWTDKSDDEVQFVILGIDDRNGRQEIVSIDRVAQNTQQATVQHVPGACYVVRSANAANAVPDNPLAQPFVVNSSDSAGACGPGQP